MVKAQDMQSILGPVKRAFPGWAYHRGWFFQLPIDFYLRGMAFKQSWSNKHVVEVLHCVYPLFESDGGLHGSWGTSRPIPGTPNHGWKVTSPDFAGKLIEVMHDAIVPATANITTGADFLHYLETQRFSHGWPDWGKALAHVHMGDLERAAELLRLYAKIIRTDHPRLQEPGTWGASLLRMLELIETDPDAIPAHCEAVARQAVKANKLEKFWEPVPFVYDARRSPRPDAKPVE